MLQRARQWIANKIAPAIARGKRQFTNFISGLSSAGVPVDDSARTHRGNQRHWSRAGGEDANTIIEAQLVTQRNRSRFERRNNGFADGMINTYANDTVGRNGPRLQVQSEDKEFNEQLERCVKEMFEVIGANGDSMTELLQLNIQQLFESGEAIEQEITDLNALTCSSLRLLPIEPDRLVTPFDRFQDPGFRMGVEMDETTGRPLRYHILEQHPGRLGTGFKFHKFNVVDADFIIHIFKRRRPGQARGVPWLASILDTFGQMRDWRGDTLLAAYIATKFAIMISSTSEQVTPDDLDEDLPIWDIEGGSATFLPVGWQATQFRPEHPATNYVEFEKALLREMGAPVGMPLLKLANDASGHNFSSARLDLSNYWVGINGIRGLLERKKLNPVTRKIAAEATLSGNLKQPPATGWRAVWIWEPIPQIDPQKEAKAQELRIKNGITTQSREAALVGEDWEDLQAQQQRENENAQELGLPLPHRERQAGGMRADEFLDSLEDIAGEEGINRVSMAFADRTNGNGGRS